VIQHNIDWNLIIVGALIGAGIIILDEVLGLAKTSMRLPPLAVGLGIYLPTSTTLMIVVGAIVGWYYDKRADRTPKAEATKQLGVLLASGMIVGESIIGVLVAAIVVFSGKATPLALVGDSFQNASIWIGGVAFAAVIFAMYRWISRMGQKS
jgi:putative OPT family oligopeptide transporter